MTTTVDPATEEFLWPSAAQQSLLHAALFTDDRALDAFERWRGSVNLEADFPSASLRLLPAVYENLRSLGSRDPLMGRLKGVYRRAWSESQQLFHRVAPVVEALVSRNVDVLVLKGAALVQSYYRNHALRPMADIDLWIPQNAVPVALSVLRDAGWKFGVDPDEDHIRFHHAVQCFGPDGGELDLHWHIFWECSRPEFDARVFATAEPLDFHGIPVRQLDPTTLLLHIVTHGVRWNRETPIRWITDGMVVLRQRGAEIDWKRFVLLAKEIRATHRTSLGLAYLAGAFDTSVPASVIDELRQVRVTLLERIDNTVLLSHEGRFDTALRQQWVTFADYCRRASARNPLEFVAGYPHFLRYRWQLGGRREIPKAIWRGIRRRLQRPALSVTANTL